MSERPLIALLSHGTDGSDNLERGIHLRWAFNPKMGFPLRGFRLSRRERDDNSKFCLNFSALQTRILTLPYDYPIFPNSSNKIRLTSEKSRELKIEPIPVAPQKKTIAAEVLQDIEIILPHTSTKIEIDLLLLPQKQVAVRTSRGGKIVNQQIIQWKEIVTPGRLPDRDALRFPQLRTITFQGAVFDRLKIFGSVLLANFCYWKCCEEGEHPWEIINGSCGFGLPFNIAYDEKQMGKQYRGLCDLDWAVTECRLGPKKACDFEGQNFADLKDVIGQMEDDGQNWPVGWSLLDQKTGQSLCPGDSETELRLSPYDLLLMQSMDPDLAKILGLYWIDTQSQPGKRYDYKIEGFWPDNPRVKWRLQNEITFDDMPIGAGGIFGEIAWSKDGVVLHGQKPLRFKMANQSRAEYGIAFHYPHAADIVVSFQKTVREVQIFVKQLGLKTKLAAYAQGSPEPVDVDILKEQEGVLAVHSERPIERLKLQGIGLIIFRIHYDEEYIPYGWHNHVICNVTLEKPLPMAIPSGLTLVCLGGGAVEETETCELVEHRFSAGLRWDLPEISDNSLLPNTPIAFHVRRHTPRREVVDVTSGNPVFIVPPQEDLKEVLGHEPELESCSEDPEKLKIKERQLFRDFVDEKGVYGYQVAAVDIFGRQSEYCSTESVELLPPVPPPPSDVNAKYLDFKTYNVESDDFGDPNLSVAEKDWLRNNMVSAIVVRWRWTEQQQTRSPEALGFRIRLHHGWLNVFHNKIDSISKDNAIREYIISTDIQNDILQDSLVGEWLRQGKMIYKIVGNTAGPNPKIHLEYPPDALGMTAEETRPREGYFALPVQCAAAVDYRMPQNWGTGTLLKEQNIADPTKEYYEIYIPDPPFPDPPFETISGQFESEKTRYAQLGVSTFSDEGEGSVSPPAAIMAVDRRTPPPQVFEDLPGLKATSADYHGKSTFPLRWPKPLDPGVKYYVFRAMDETIFMVDWALRPRSDLQPGQTEFFPATMTNAQHRQQICDELNALNGFDKNEGKAQAMACYRGLSNNALKVLAGLEGMDQAFAKLNDNPISKSDPAYQDRDTNIPAPGVAPRPGDPNMLLFIDTTLDGRGRNRYFYRIRPIDEIANMGPLGVATLPVEIPKVTPVIAPVITSISGGDRQITIKWAGNPGAGILGYLIFRTDQKSVVDMRNMELRKLAAGDTYSVAVADQGTLAFEYTDRDVVARTPYYYAIAAITAGEGGKKLLSRLSPIKSTQAYDLTPPQPPVWVSLTRSTGGQVATLSWKSPDSFDCIVMRQTNGRRALSVSSWLQPQSTESQGGQWLYGFEDPGLTTERSYVYYLIIKNPIGVKSESERRELPK
ncbi:MAG: fibronectin type III domain-containing protein [Thermodesulfobacteriota bacterium]